MCTVTALKSRRNVDDSCLAKHPLKYLVKYEDAQAEHRRLALHMCTATALESRGNVGDSCLAKHPLKNLVKYEDASRQAAATSTVPSQSRL